MSLSTIKALLWLVTLTVFGGLGYTLYDWQQNQGSLLATRAPASKQRDVLENVERPEPPKQQIHSYEGSIEPNFFRLNWTGKEAPPPPPPPGPDDVPVAKPRATPIAELLRVLYVQVDTSLPEYSKALVRLTDAALARLEPEPLWLYVGDALPEPQELWVVHSIHDQGVTFRRLLDDGQPDPEVEDESASPSDAFEDQALIVAVGAEGAMLPDTQAFPPLAGEGYYTGRRPPTTVEVRPNVFAVGSEDMAMINESYLDILSTDVRTRTFRDSGGNPGGIQLLEVAPGSLAAKHGAKTGDVIKSINGTPVNSTQEAISYVKNNADNYTVWTVVVWNSGKERTVTYEVP